MDAVNIFLAEKGIYMLTVILFFLGMFGMAIGRLPRKIPSRIPTKIVTMFGWSRRFN